MFSLKSLLPFLALSPLALADSYGPRSGYNWAASQSLKVSVAQSTKNDCSGAGSFFIEYGGLAICVSTSTTSSPGNGLTCPFGWNEHNGKKVCVPPKEIAACDCGEGYGFTKPGLKCQPKTGNCRSDEWWHDRSKTCCDKDWQHNPPKGDCPPTKYCPTGWFWHKYHKKCRPNGPRSPIPDCDNWDEPNQCCHNHPQPSQRALSNRKRDFQARQQTAFPQSELDVMYCPGNLHACSVAPQTAGEWAYECVDFDTELESCGGCASTGQGMDCSSIANAKSVGCEKGVCQVYTCQHGFRSNGTECVPASSGPLGSAIF